MEKNSLLIFLTFAMILLANNTCASEASQQAAEGIVSYDADADIACYKSYSGITLNQTFEDTMSICLKAAESGAQGSQNFVGVIYLIQGQKEKAVYWLKKAASKGHTDAIEILKYIDNNSIESKEKENKKNPELIQNSNGEPLALIDLDDVMNADGCTTHLGTFEVKDIVYDGVSEIVGGIRVLPLEPDALNPDKAPTLIRFSTSDLPNSSASWVSTLVKEGRKLLVAYNICGNGGYHNAVSIYRLDRLN